MNTTQGLIVDDPEKDKLIQRVQSFHAAMERGDVTQAEAIAVECLVQATAEAEKNPSEEVRLAVEAGEHEDAGRWEQAKATHRQRLALAEADGHVAMLFKPHYDLSNLFAICGPAASALHEAQKALEVARKADMPPLLLMALESVFWCHVRQGDLMAATTTAAEAVGIVPGEKMYDLARARTLLMRAWCRLEERQVSQAQQDLQVAWELLSPQASATIMAGVQSSLARWWEITARSRTHSKDLAGAAQAMGQAVEFRRTVSHLPQLGNLHKSYSLANTLQQYQVTLLAIGEVEAASRASEESREIQARIGVIIPLPGPVE